MNRTDMHSSVTKQYQHFCDKINNYHLFRNDSSTITKEKYTFRCSDNENRLLLRIKTMCGLFYLWFNIMFAFIKTTKFIAFMAIGGALSAIFGALCGWKIFPFLVNFNVKQVSLLWTNRSKANNKPMDFSFSANCFGGRYRTIRTLGHFASTITF